MIIRNINSDTSIAILDNPSEVMDKKYDKINLITEEGYAGKLNQIKDDEWAFGKGISGKETWEMLMKGRLNSSLKKKYDETSFSFKREAILPSVKRRKRKDEYDGEICIDSYLANDSSYYRKVRRVSSKTKSIRVLINVGYNCGHSAEELFKNVKSSIKKVENLIKSGYIVEVYAADFTKDFGRKPFDKLLILIKIKESDKPLDCFRLQTAVLPGFFRSAVFRAMNIINDLYEVEANSCLGEPVNIKQNRELLNSILTHAKKQLNSKIIYFDGSTKEGLKGIEF